MSPSSPALVIGRYRLFDVIGSGGMASVHLARQSGGAGFVRSVAVKRLHPQHASNAEFATMFLDEARLASRIRHLNVVETIDVVETGSEILMVMELVEGATLTTLLRSAAQAGTRLPLPIASAIVSGMLRGLHAAHTAVGPLGMPLNIVHRDVSPHNVMIGIDGVPRVLDFGVAKANGQAHATRHGEVRGKPAYMAPEHLREGATSLSDIYSAGVVLWEVLASERLFQADSEGGLIARVLEGRIRRVPTFSPPVPADLEAIALKALSRNPLERYPSAAAMADALERVMPPASPAEVAMAVERWAGRQLADLRAALFTIDADESQPVLPAIGAAAGAAMAGAAMASGAHALTPNPPRYLESVRPNFGAARAPGDITLTGPSDGPALMPARRTSAPPHGPFARPHAAPPTSPRRPRRWPFIVGAIAAGVGFGSVLVMVLEQRAPAAPDARANERPDDPEPQVSVGPSAPPPDQRTPTPPIATEEALAPSGSPSTSAPETPPAPQPTSIAGLPAPPASATPSSLPTATALSNRPDCNPPWELDQNGVQRVKVRCFKVKP